MVAKAQPLNFMSDVIISVEGLGKRYVLTHQEERPRYVALRDVITDKVRGLFYHGGLPDQASPYKSSTIAPRHSPGAKPPLPHHSPSPASEEFWALKNVSFEIRRGEVVGIIGRNGSGKSTLLKILSQITEPTTGRVTLRGRVASLLEVGTGFHPELTGRENIFLNGSILGMCRAEIKKKFDEIVAFADVAQFLDTQVKRYSSGMYVRLAFAVAAHLEPEILIVDEVLAVGDAEFQKRCLGKMHDVAVGGRTVLFVSHNMAAMRRLCQKGILLNKGEVRSQGNFTRVVTDYTCSNKAEKPVFIANGSKRPPGNDIATLLSVAVKGADGSSGPHFGCNCSIIIEITYRVLRVVRGLRCGFHLLSHDNTIVFNTTDAEIADCESSTCPSRVGSYTSCCSIPAGFLNHGQYCITVGSDTPMGVNFYCENVVTFFVEPTGAEPANRDNRPGLVCPKLPWKVRAMNHEPEGILL